MTRLVMFLMLVGALYLPAQASAVPENENPPQEAQETQETSSSLSFWNIISWPFIHVVQPFFGALVYPVAAPLHYAFDNGVLDKAVELITFGENKNILIYPVMNLKPGTATMLGFCYRHRNLIRPGDYAVFEGNYFANSDVYGKIRYSKQGVFGKDMFAMVSSSFSLDRDRGFVIPGALKESFLQSDTSFNVSSQVGIPLTESRNLNLSFGTEFNYHIAYFPDTKDSVLYDAKYPIEDRGLYQSHFEFPFYVNLVFDNLDYPYAPSRGNRLSLKASYVLVGKYSGIGVEDFSNAGISRAEALEDGGKNHDFISVEAFYQIYFFIGKAKNYVLTSKEGRKTRRFYTDFSMNEALRVWRPENLVETLFERRVLAFQFRFLGMWEMEKGGAPYTAFPSMNARFPLRGYTDEWTSPFMMGLSAEYRWPIDRLVDGVVFEEYGIISDKINHWSKKNLYNSWGFGVRVRKPDLYLFRMQFGFHGFHGISLVMTIAPEFR